MAGYSMSKADVHTQAEGKQKCYINYSGDIPPSRVYNNVCFTKFQNAKHTVVEQQHEFWPC